MNIHKKKIERWYLFHDGIHNWDRYADGHNPDGKSEYYLDFCNDCFKLKDYEAEKFRGQGTLCVPICKCKNEITDYEKFKKLFDEMGIEYREGTEDGRNKIINKALFLEEGMTKVTGYPGFATIFEFDMDTEKFIEVGAWE